MKLTSRNFFSSCLWITKDGEHLDGVKEVNAREGWALVYAKDAEGNLAIKNGEVTYRVVAGDIKVGFNWKHLRYCWPMFMSRMRMGLSFWRQKAQARAQVRAEVKRVLRECTYLDRLGTQRVDRFGDWRYHTSIEWR